MLVRHSIRLVFLWIQGLLLATLGIWAIGAVFVSSAGVWEYSEQAEYMLPAEHVRYRRSEGNGWTQYGCMGVQNLADTSLSHPPTLLVWGDSHIDAGQVPGSESMASAFNRRQVNKCAADRLIAFGISGGNVATYAHLMPALKQEYPHIRKHFFVLAWDDFLGSEIEWTLDGKLKPAAISIPMNAYRPVIYKWRLNSFWALLKQVRSGCLHLRLKVGPVPKKVAVDEEVQLASLRDLSKVMRLLAEAAGGPERCCILVNSRYPQLNDGEICFDDPRSDFWRSLVGEARRQGIGVIDLRSYFNQAARKHGFPRGFSNTYPDRGHWNRRGHEIVAQALLDYVASEDAK